MADFTLDTSGEIVGPHLAFHGDRYMIMPGSNDKLAVTRWPDLSPFEQGYVRGVFETFRRGDIGHWPDKPHAERVMRFDRIAPETLAAIRKDCADYQERAAKSEADVLAYSGASNAAKVRHAWLGGGGAQFWVQRNTTDNLRAFFPPLTPYLADDGKVYLREAS